MKGGHRGGCNSLEKWSVSMIREILFALLGHPGNLIREEGGKFVVEESFSALLPPERELVNKIVQSGYYFVCVSRFVSKVCFPSRSVSFDQLGRDEDEEEKEWGPYYRALCCGIEEILASYRSKILELEEVFLSAPPLTLAHIYSSLLQPHGLVLSSLNELVGSLGEEKKRGKEVLLLLQKYVDCGNQCISYYFSHLLDCCLGVFVVQLEGWLFSGTLPPSSSFDDFLIVEESGFEEDGSFTSGEDPNSSILLTQAWEKKYSISSSLIPHFLSLETAKEILFCGKSVELLVRGDITSSSTAIDPARSVLFHERAHEPYKDVGILLTDLVSLTDQLRPLKCVQPLKSYEMIGDFQPPLAHSAKIQPQPQSQPQPKLHISFLIEDLLRLTSTCVSFHLYQFVVVNSHLSTHLQICRDIFLFARADIFHHFLTHSSSLLSRILLGKGEGGERVLQQAFSRSLLTCEVEDDENLSRFCLTSSPTPTTPVFFEYAPPWPVRILLSRPQIQKYNSIFGVLLQLKFAKSRLDRAWTAISFLRKRPPISGKGKVCPDLHVACCLRSQMSFFLDVLLHQLQIQLIDLHFAKMETATAATTNFHQVEEVHSHFLDQVFFFFLSFLSFLFFSDSFPDSSLSISLPCSSSSMFGQNYRPMHHIFGFFRDTVSQ